MGDLDAYRRTRDFASTPEPLGERHETSQRRFVIQKHAARRLHYDLRLEHDGVLLSWAVPKGPSLDPRTRRLAVQTEDHPIEYADFEGTIPAGQYGGGRVLVWDRGTWIPQADPGRDYARGHLRFRLQGEKLHGRWSLVRIDDDNNWLLIKSRDEFARSGDDADIVDALPSSVLSGRRIDELDELDSPTPPVELPIISPQLATLVAAPPEGPSWLHEIKLDGYRILAYVRGDEVRLRTRGGEDWTARLPEIAAALSRPALANSVLDGELCLIGPDGHSSFDQLQRALAEGRSAELVYSVFDLPFAAGHDIRDLALHERKRMLRQRLERLDAKGRVRFWSHVVGSGGEVFERACALGTEGVISKRADSPYQSGRTRAWLKAKCPRRLTVVVGGFTPPQGSRRHFGALLVGTYDDDGQLRYRGKVGSGFSEDALAQLGPRLEQLRQTQPAFVDAPTGPAARGVEWLAPKLEIDVEYADLTDKGRLRQARYLAARGVMHRVVSRRNFRRGREAKMPLWWAHCKFWRQSPRRKGQARRREALHHGLPAARGRGRTPTSHASTATSVRLTHPDKLLYPDFKPQALSKREVANYLMQVSAWMLPHLRDRPLTLVRCPDGVGAPCFYQKHAMPGLPDSVTRVPIRESDGSEVVYASVADALGLVGLVQMSVLEIHPWSSRIDKLDYPDRLIFDLDPDIELEFSRVVDAAFEIRDRLAELGLRSFVKTTGGKGLHVVVPVERRLPFGPSKHFCRALALRMADDSPERYTALGAKAARRGKIFIDYLRNGRGATSIAPYSLRAKPGAPVSTPLAWDELEPKRKPERFDATTVPARLAQLDHDPWAEFFELRQSIV